MTSSRRYVSLLSLLAALICALVLVPAAFADSERGGVIVALESSASAQQAADAVEAAGGQIVHASPSTRTMLVRIPERTTEASAARRISSLPGVRYAEPNHRVRAQALPNDSMYSLQWGLPAVNAPLAWGGARGSSAVKVAVVDSGVYFDHPDLRGILDSTNDYDYVNKDSDASDDNGHGTHVTGLVAAITNNGAGVASLAGFGASTSGGVRVVPFKVLDENGEGWDEDVALAIRRAADVGARVINLSMGGPGATVLTEAVAYARAKGCVVVAAAGNSGLDQVLYPAGIPGVIGVASVDSQLRQDAFSNSGPHVDVCAPGAQVFSTEWPLAYNSGGELYGYMSGTSMATPFVASEAALLFSAKPSATGPQVENAILSSAKDLGPAGRDDDYGRGLIDAAKALSVLVGYDYTAPSTRISGLPEGWSSSDVTVTLSATDDLSGVAATYARVGGAQAIAYSGPVKVSTEGGTSIVYWSVDRAGNRETESTAIVRIDRTPPRTTTDALSRYVGTATVRLAAGDNSSGVESTQWYLDGVAGTGPVVQTSAHGFHTLAYFSTDRAGNVEASHALGFGVLNSANEVLPLTTTTLGVSAGWARAPATITLVSSGSGLAGSAVWYSLDGGPATQYAAPFVVSKEGTTKLETWSSASGETEQHNTAFVRIDSLAPQLKIVAEPVYDNEASIGATAIDAGSGVDANSIAWSIDGSRWTPGLIADIPWPGRYTLRFRVSDLAGNVTQESTPVVVTGASSVSVTTPALREPVWGAPVRFTGAVSPAPTGLAAVTIQARTAGSAVWVRTSTVITDVNGRFSASVKPRVRTEYRAVFGGDGVLRASSPSTSFALTPHVWLSPVDGTALTVAAGTSLRLSGRITPAHATGSAVYLLVEKPAGTGWTKSVRIRLALRPDGRGGSTWSHTRTLPPGSWRLRVYHPYDGLHATTYSGVRYVRVK